MSVLYLRFPLVHLVSPGSVTITQLQLTHLLKLDVFPQIEIYKKKLEMLELLLIERYFPPCKKSTIF